MHVEGRIRRYGVARPFVATEIHVVEPVQGKAENDILVGTTLQRSSGIAISAASTSADNPPCGTLRPSGS
jgi:hypothetical protein